jgi:hypothetical protein
VGARLQAAGQIAVRCARGRMVRPCLERAVCLAGSSATDDLSMVFCWYRVDPFLLVPGGSCVAGPGLRSSDLDIFSAALEQVLSVALDFERFQNLRNLRDIQE